MIKGVPARFLRLLYSLKKSRVLFPLLALIIFPVSVLYLIIFKPNIVLAYHKVCKSLRPSDNLYDISVTKLTIERQTSLLNMIGYIAVREINSKVRGQYVMTYDDGYISTFESINSSPLLASMPAIHFLSKEMLEGEYNNWAVSIRQLTHNPGINVFNLENACGEVFNCKIELYPSSESNFWLLRSKFISESSLSRITKLARIYKILGEQMNRYEDLFATSAEVSHFLETSHWVACHGLKHESIHFIEESILSRSFRSNFEFLSKITSRVLTEHALPYGIEPNTVPKEQLLRENYNKVYLTRPFKKPADFSYLVPRICVSQADGLLLFLIKCSGVINTMRRFGGF